jgi:hypothetical protein
MGPGAFLDVITSMKLDVVQWGAVLIGVYVVRYGLRKVMTLVNEEWPDFSKMDDRELRYWEVRNNRT